MLGIKALFEQKGINEAYFIKNNGFYRYDLWFLGAEYSVLFKRFNKELVEASFLQFGLDKFDPMNPKTNKFNHITCDFNRLIEVFSKVENEVYYDRGIPFKSVPDNPSKPFVLWDRFSKEIEKKGGE